MEEQVLIDRIRTLCGRELLPIPTGQVARAERMDGVRAVVFDVYGTLFVSGCGDIGLTREDQVASALEAALGASGFTGPLAEAGREAPAMLTAAVRRSHEAERAAGTRHPEVDIVEIWSEVVSALEGLGLLEAIDGAPGEASGEAARLRRLAVEYECRVNPVWPMPGADETLARLRRSGIRLGIVSNAQFFTPLLFDALLGRSVARLGFDDPWCEWSWRTREAKPGAGLFRSLLGRLRQREGLEPDQVLYVGNDMLNDVWAAARAGCRTALFAADRRSLRLREDDPRCRDLRPDRVVTDLAQVADLVVA